MIKKLDIVALGGNAILAKGGDGTIEEQRSVTRHAMEEVFGLLSHGRRVVLTHGNGPIVGNIVIRNEAVKDSIPPMPLDVCGADSQGGIGYVIQQTLRNVLAENNTQVEVVTVVTQVRVDGDDPAFRAPKKPIGPYYTREQGRRLEAERGWVVVEDSGRGFRRVVASPYPLEIVEKSVIERLVSSRVVVIAVGGGGIPIVSVDGRYEGCEAVIDKDLASSLLARELGAERMIILTDVDAVYKDFGRKEAAPMRRVGLAEIRALFDDGYFPAGSMGSKIQSAIEFLESGGETVIICRPEHLTQAVQGGEGTTIGRSI